jgi:hypothetical protein
MAKCFSVAASRAISRIAFKCKNTRVCFGSIGDTAYHCCWLNEQCRCWWVVVVICAVGTIGEALASKGACGRYGVDFLAVRTQSLVEHNETTHEQWVLHALEINLRQGGTTHPYETLRLVSSIGSYDESTGLYRVLDRPKFYTASDSIHAEHYKGLLPSDLLSIMRDNNIGFRHDTRTGVVFHLMGSLSQYGKVGVTCIGDSHDEAQSLHNEIMHVLERETSMLAALVAVKNLVPNS